MYTKTENQPMLNDGHYIHRSLRESNVGTMETSGSRSQAIKWGITCNCPKYKLYSIILTLPVRVDQLWVSADSLLSSMCLQSCGIS